MEKGQGRGGSRPGAGRKSKNPYVRRKTGAWNVEEWIPLALQQLAKEKGIGSASDIVNEALKALCYLFGKREPGVWYAHPDRYKTARWRFFTDQELQELLEALGDRWGTQGRPHSGPLHDVWFSAWQALEPSENAQSFRGSLLDRQVPNPDTLVAESLEQDE